MAYYGKYDTPKQVLDDHSLSQGAKIEMLESWRDDKEAYMRASEEGMGGEDRSHILKEVEKALIALRAEMDKT